VRVCKNNIQELWIFLESFIKILLDKSFVDGKEK